MNHPIAVRLVPFASMCVFFLGDAACGHVIHPAAVQPRFSFEVLGGQANVRHEPLPTGHPPADPPSTARGASGFLEPPGKFDPYDSWRAAVQMGFGYGWRFNRNTGLQFQAIFGNRSVPGLDGYVQLLGGTVDAGVGLVGALGYFGPYVMVGRGWPLTPRSELRTDVGVRGLQGFGATPSKDSRSWGPMALVSLRRGRVAGGLWSDGLFLNRVSYDLYCDETCKPANFVRRRIAVGLYLRAGTDLFAGRAGAP